MSRAAFRIAGRHRGVRESVEAHPISPLVFPMFSERSAATLALGVVRRSHTSAGRRGTGDSEAFGLRKDRSPSASLAAATSRIGESLRGTLRKILFSH